MPAPAGVAERLARIPDGDAPIRVERHAGADGEPYFEVFVAGTVGDAPAGGAHPFDMASNIALVAEADASSLAAVRQALADAGAEPGSGVVFTGYSQGGAVAALLAESGEWRTLGLITAGAPTGGIPVTGDYPAVVIAHDADPIPALGGPMLTTEAVVVTAQAELAPRGAGDPVVAAHELGAYRATGDRVDASPAPMLAEAIARMPAPAAGPGTGDVGAAPTGAAIRYTARRLDG